MLIDNVTRGSSVGDINSVVSYDPTPPRSEGKKKQKYRLIRKKYPKIYRYEKSGGEYFVVDCRSKQWGVKGRKNFNNEVDAVKYAQEIDEQIQKNGAAVSNNLIYQSKDIERWSVMLQPHGKTLVDAVKHYVGYLEGQIKASFIPNICDLVEPWKTEMTDEVLNPIAHRTSIEYKSLGKFIIRKFGHMRPNEVTKKHVDAALKEIKAEQVTRQKYLQYTNNFFNWCIKQKYVPENPAADINLKIRRKEVKTFNSEEVENLLRICQEKYPSMLGYYCLCVFAGIRPSEAERVEWEHLNFEAREIFVVDKSKTGLRRFVIKDADTLWHWLEHIKATRPNEPLNPLVAHENMQRKIREEMGVWHQDVLRHTFGSCYYNLIHDLNKVSFDMGNSVAVCRKHYLRAVSKSDVMKLWGLRPSSIAAQSGESKSDGLTETCQKKSGFLEQESS